MIFPIKDISWKEIALFTNDLSAIHKKTLSRRLDWNLILRIHINVSSSFLFEEIFKNLFNSQSQYWKASVAKARFFGLRCLANSINERYEVDNGLRTLPTDLSVCIFFHCHPRIALLNTAKFSIYNPRQIKLGHPVLYPYSDQRLCSFPPSVDFFAWHGNSQKPTLSGQKISLLSQLMWQVL